jgi:hypothetical protein
MLSLVLFSFTLKTWGVVFATMAAVFISSMADRGIGWRARLLLSVGVAALTYVIFIMGLSMVLPVWPWSA